MPARPVRQVLAVGLGQVLAFGSTMYLSAVIVGPLGREIGVSSAMFFAAYSCALVVMAMIGPVVGRRIDGHGGRGILMLSNAVMAVGLAALASVQGPLSLFAAWALLGLGMGLGQYDAAFASLVHEHRRAAARMIVGVTLIGGFASTVAWPLSAWWTEGLGWRACCGVWAGLHLVIGLPLHGLSLRRAPPPGVDAGADAVAASSAAGPPTAPRAPADVRWLAAFAACTAFVTSALAVHLPGLLQAAGCTLAQALVAGMLLGPAQVAARLGEYLMSQRHGLHPLSTARLATAMHPLACTVLAGFGGLSLAGAAFAVLHGAGAGMISVARGVLPLALFGPTGYGAITGRIARVARSMQAFAPFAYALVLEAGGARAALALSGGLSAVALLALLRLQR